MQRTWRKHMFCVFLINNPFLGRRTLSDNLVAIQLQQSNRTEKGSTFAHYAGVTFILRLLLLTICRFDQLSWLGNRKFQYNRGDSRRCDCHVFLFRILPAFFSSFVIYMNVIWYFINIEFVLAVLK